MPSDDSLSMDGDAEEGFEVLLDEIKNKEKSLRDAVYNLHKATSKEQRTTLIKKAEQFYKQAKENINVLKDDLSSYNGNKKKTYQTEMKKLEQAIAKSYNDLTQIKENRETPGSVTTPTGSDHGGNLSANTPTGSRKSSSAKTDDGMVTTPGGSSSGGGSKKGSSKKNYDEQDGAIIMDDDGANGQPKQLQKGHSRVDEILTIYDKNNEMLDNMIRIGDETIQIGAAAAEKLKQQTERMVLIQKDLDELGDGLKRAKKELNAFIRGTNCDKAVICIFIIIVLVMVAVIIGWQVAKYVCIKGVTNTCIGGFSNSSSFSVSGSLEPFKVDSLHSESASGGSSGSGASGSGVSLNKDLITSLVTTINEQQKKN
ncbi:hypothetical protein C9374_006763 [Naegleria lovaniensis]|uniref:t-SNARE coiled-coil homology domain-containing protein n=1 Tax=Naegleria lovaniensis TaxID=51637 RepID=A0AA88KIX7_NAELO|nr:uncharacterized protein C9374_006763 [Naegleria lovaniensis]KAG2379646.1 hypothetical protein C9374_006763 [Naegleria lovaniensis]